MFIFFNKNKNHCRLEVKRWRCSLNQCLVFSHSDDSPQYSACNTKYGDISNSAYSYPSARPWNNKIQQTTSVRIENKIKPKNMGSWFAQNYSGSSMSTGYGTIENFFGVENIITSECTSIRGLFLGQKYLTFLNLSTWDTSSVTDMSSAFSCMNGLDEINVSRWNTSNVTNMESMFKGCTALTSLSVGSFDTSKVENMTQMFAFCTNLNQITYGSDFVGSALSERTNSGQPGSYQMYKSCPANKPSWFEIRTLVSLTQANTYSDYIPVSNHYYTLVDLDNSASMSNKFYVYYYDENKNLNKSVNLTTNVVGYNDYAYPSGVKYVRFLDKSYSRTFVFVDYK